MTGERVFYSRLKHKLPTYLIPPRHQREAKKAKPRKTLVRKGGLEPPRFYPPDPKSGASANSATFALR